MQAYSPIRSNNLWLSFVYGVSWPVQEDANARGRLLWPYLHVYSEVIEK